MVEDASEEVLKEKPIVEFDASIPDVPINRNLINSRNSEEPAEALESLDFKQNHALKSVIILLETDQKEDESECE